jgi:hypothetical protein
MKKNGKMKNENEKDYLYICFLDVELLFRCINRPELLNTSNQILINIDVVDKKSTK